MCKHESELRALELFDLKLQSLTRWNSQLLNRGEYLSKHFEGEKTFMVTFSEHVQKDLTDEFDICDKKFY